MKNLLVVLTLVLSAFSLSAQIQPLPNTCLCYVEPILEPGTPIEYIVEDGYTEIVYTQPSFKEEMRTFTTGPTTSTITDECATCVGDVAPTTVTKLVKVKAKPESWTEVAVDPIIGTIPTFKIRHAGGWYNVPLGSCQNGLFVPSDEQEIEITGSNLTIK